MINLTYIIVLLLIAFWAIGYFIFNVGAVVHLLLVVSVVLMILRTVLRSKINKHPAFKPMQISINKNK